MLDLLRKAVTAKSIDTHITRLIDTYEAAKGLSKKLLTSTSYMVPVATFSP